MNDIVNNEHAKNHPKVAIYERDIPDEIRTICSESEDSTDPLDDGEETDDSGIEPSGPPPGYSRHLWRGFNSAKYFVYDDRTKRTFGQWLPSLRCTVSSTIQVSSELFITLCQTTRGNWNGFQIYTASPIHYLEVFSSRLNWTYQHKLIRKKIPLNFHWFLDVGCGPGCCGDGVLSEHPDVNLQGVGISPTAESDVFDLTLAEFSRSSAQYFNDESMTLINYR